MDWSKAKNILILMFIILNIFLSVYLATYIKNLGESSQAVTAVINILKKNGVTIDPACRIPEYKKDTPMLIFENSGIDRIKVIEKLFGKDYIDSLDPDELAELNRTKTITDASKTVIFKNEFTFSFNNDAEVNNIDSAAVIDINKERETEKYLRNYFENMGINISRYITDKYIINNDMATIVFIEKYKGFLVYSNKISVNVDKNGIKSIDYCAREIKGFGKSKSPIIPAYQVILKGVYNERDIVIKSIDLGFKRNDTGSARSTPDSMEIGCIPVWRVVISDGREIFLEAYTGEVIE